jgi:hypothetical protein
MLRREAPLSVGGNYHEQNHKEANGVESRLNHSVAMRGGLVARPDLPAVGSVQWD